MNDKKGSNSKIRALVVEDDRLQLKLLIIFLKKLNIEGNTATNGIKAIELARKGHYDICFMDIHMPVMGGVEATKFIKKENSKDMPIIAITAVDDFTYEKSLEIGMDDYLSKPVDIETLKAVISKHCIQAN